jgi:uncharacterized protein YbjT (DUF2867 family)
MKSPKDTVAVARHGMYVILGANGNTGSIIANFLLSKGQKVRVVGREAVGVLAAQEPRSPKNTTPTSFETFVQDVFAPAYHGKALTA